jgi:predicted nucleic acid-binding protein
VSKTIFLDTGPLSILTNPRFPTVTVDAIQWSVDLMAAGHRFIVPAIADFELRRELERTGSLRSLTALDAFNGAVPNRYLPLTDSALKRGAKLWGQARNKGALPGDPKELNGDILITAQVLELQAVEGLATSDIVIASVNVGHLSLFAPADLWQNIAP